MSTGFDVEKLSLEDSDVSSSELAMHHHARHLYSAVTRRVSSKLLNSFVPGARQCLDLTEKL